MSDDDRKAERLSSRVVYDGRTMRLEVEHIRLPNGREMDFELVHHPGAAAVVPVLPSGEVVMIRQYRHATGGWLREIPAGQLDPGESPEDCARREMVEEIGYRAVELVPLGWIWATPGFCNEKIWLFLAPGIEPATQDLQADEVLTLERLPFAEAVAQAASGELVDVKSVCALLRADRLAPAPPTV